MKTIAEIARELGVTKPAVRRYLTENIREQYAETVNGVIYISEQGEALIKAKFAKTKPENSGNTSGNVSENISENVCGNEAETVSALISMLQKELALKNKQIEELTATIRIQAESINAANKNNLAETIIDGQHKLVGAEKSKKRWQFWKKN